jgi:hypothetical protein
MIVPSREVTNRRLERPLLVAPTRDLDLTDLAQHRLDLLPLLGLLWFRRSGARFAVPR